MFFCEHCNFSSKYNRDFNRHLSTLKHYKKIEMGKISLSEKKPKMSKLEHTLENFTHEKSPLFAKKSDFWSKKNPDRNCVKSPNSPKSSYEESDKKAQILGKKSPKKPTKKPDRVLIKSPNSSKSSYEGSKKKAQTTDKKSPKKPTFTIEKPKSKKKSKKKTLYFKCDGCGNTYTRNSNLIRHQKQKSCGVIGTVEVKKNTKNTLISQIHILSTQLKEKNKILESKEEHFRGILEEKERCIQILREQNKHITSSHFQIIQNNIIDMNAIKFLNAYCSNNPTLSEITTRMQETKLSSTDTNLLRSAFEFGNLNIIGDTINRILKDKNREIIEERGVGIGTCDNVIFCNDGSGRKYIAKGEPGWTYFCSDEPLDKAIRDVIQQSNQEENTNYLNSKDRITILKKVKKDNDWNDSKQKVIDNILGKQAISHSFTIQPIETQVNTETTSLLIPIEDNKDI